ncbi:sensor histidine kinase [Paenibacillus sp. NPDC058071]|uniref:cache domain-containing sensor histidine kinase n=1 Tax=Paenibacillus sp. NPDC058071 TaxID=3346326 RepID=UPI0036DDC811
MSKPFPGWELPLQTYLRKSKIKNRLIVSLLLLSIVPLFASAWIFYSKSVDAVSSNISGYSLQVLDQLKFQIQRENKKLEYLSDQIMTHNLVQTSLRSANANSDPELLKSTYYDINQAFSGRKLLDQIKSLQIYNSSNELIYDLGYDKLDRTEIVTFTEMMRRRDGNDLWTYTVTQYGVDCIVLARTIRSQNNWNEELGSVFLAMKESHYSRDIFETIDLGEGADVFLIDQNGVVLSSRNAGYAVGRPYPDGSLMRKIALHEQLGERTFETQLQDRQQLVAYSYDSNARWYLVGVIPRKHLARESQQIMPYLIIVVCLSLFFSILITFLLSRSISKPLNRLVHRMKQVSLGNFRIQDSDSSPDELGYLSVKFDSMIEEISGLIRQMQNEQRLKRETELQMLQAQINPHFLFNTLNSIKWTATLSRADTVADGLNALAELLRNTIVDKEEFVPLRRELDNIENYVVIQRLRYGVSFTVIYEIGDELSGSSVLKFMLQPIIENALIHGLEESQDNGFIVISAVREGGDLRIAVRDNGRGMDGERLKRLFDPTYRANQRLSGIGLTNVQERLQLHFGDRYGLTVTSEIGEGTKVELLLPWMEAIAE